MLVTLVWMVVCALVARARGGSWWLWGLGGGIIDLVTTVGLAVLAAKSLGISVRSPTGGNAVSAAAWAILIIPRLLALAAVYIGTRSSAAAPRVARSHRAPWS